MISKKITTISAGENRCPLMIEILPPEKGLEQERLNDHAAYLEMLRDKVDIDILNIPEIQNESKKSDKGKRTSPFRQRIAPREWAHKLTEMVDVPAVINRVIVKETPEDQEEWLLETHEQYDIRNVVFVGGESPEIEYQGPSVPEGNELVKNGLNDGKRHFNDKDRCPPTDFSVGNICIPTRKEGDFSEAERMFYKFRTGADFFTTQIITESASAKKVMNEFSGMLQKHNVSEPPVIYWSFSPISSEKDINFLRWLGVYIPDDLEEEILESENPAAKSIAHMEQVWHELLEENLQLPVPLSMGKNISVMGKRNYPNAAALARTLDSVAVAQD